MKSALSFLSGINEKDNIVTIFHNDADGICAATILNVFLKKRTGKESFVISQPMPVDNNIIDKIKTTIPSKIIFLDLAVDQQQNLLKRVAGICDETLVIDHHLVSMNSNSRKIVHYNPRFKSPKIYQSASYIIYKLCSQITDIEERLWIAVVGSIGDYNLEDSQDMIEKARKKYPEMKSKKPYDTTFGRYADMISSVNATKELSCEEIVKILESCRSPEDFMKSGSSETILRSYHEIENEIMAALVDAEKRAEKVNNAVFYEAISKNNTRSMISTKLSEKYPEKMIIVYEKIRNKVKLSVRNQNRNLHAEKILKKATEGFNAVSGGHEAAAGASLNENDWNKIKERIIALLE